MPVNDMALDDFFAAIGDGETINVYTDGSCLGNPGPGGWGVVFLYKDNRANISGAEKAATNNKMELLATIKALQAITKNVKVVMHTDSAYVKNGITSWIDNWVKNNWISTAKKPVKNRELWESLLEETSNKDVTWVWVKGHADDANNNNADCLAKSAAISSYIAE